MQITLDPNSPMQRRAHERHPLAMRIWATIEGRGSWLQVTDVSLESLGCFCERRFQPMSRLVLSLDVTGGRGERNAKPLDIEAIVFRCVPQDGAWRLGLRLPHHNSQTRERFVRFLRSRIIDDHPPERDQG